MKLSSLYALLGAAIIMALPNLSQAKYQPKDYAIKAETQGFPGAKATMQARIAASPEAVWRAIIDANNHAGKYPKIKRSYCVPESVAVGAKKKRLSNGATVDRLYKKDKCVASTLRQEGQKWGMHLFQELDYPFPLSDRWMITTITNDETQKGQKKYTQTGKLYYGRQDIYEFTIKVSPHPKNPSHAKFDFFVWTDPGGLIMDWMIEQATKYIAPEFMRVLEVESKKQAAKM